MVATAPKGIEQLDPTGAVRDVGRYIREQRRQAELSLRNLAKQAGVSNPYLSQIERGLRQPSARILKDIAKALRISAETLYVKAGILDEATEDTDLVVAILRDPYLTERQKQVLVDIYTSFRAGAQAPAPAAEG
jgi:transcriptional regulator with XRE-family HTH domain